MIVAATLCSSFALLSVLVGIYCLLQYGPFAGDHHPVWLDRAQASLLACAVFSFLVVVILVLL